MSKKTIGFAISSKENEKRRAVTPEDLSSLDNPGYVYFEEGYGEVLGISDEEFEEKGCHVCSREEILQKDIVCDPKIGDADYLKDLKSGQTIFGWVHATQNRDITDILVENELTAYAWEKMNENGRHVFWRNNELAGEAAVMNAFQFYGRMPYETNCAVLGKGNTAKGAVRVLYMLGANVMQYDYYNEDLFKQEIGNYDVIVNCILWDVTRSDHIIFREDLKKMKKASMIIDVSCDRNGGIETCIPTTIENPTYVVDGVLHYAVDHTPSLLYKTFSYENSKILCPYLDQLITGDIGPVLKDSLIIQNGIILDDEINKFQNR